jgi:hypothetical protein
VLPRFDFSYIKRRGRTEQKASPADAQVLDK